MKRILNSLLLAAGVLAAGAASAARFDVDGDGKSDMLWYHTGVFGLISMSGNGLTLAPWYAVKVQSDANWELRGVADLNGDGRSDIVWRNKATGEVTGMLMNGSTVLQEARIYSEPNLNWDVAAVADVNGDGKSDLVWRYVPTGELYVNYLDGLTNLGGANVDIEANIARRFTGVGDLNGDGKQELFWRNEASGILYATYSWTTPGTYATESVDVPLYQETNANWKVAGFGDFNGDGKTDILWRNSGTGEVYELLMNGPLVAGGQVIYRERNEFWQIVATGDYNGDGKADIVWRNTSSGAVFMMLMNGFSIASSGFVYQEESAQWQVVEKFNSAPVPAPLTKVIVPMTVQYTLGSQVKDGRALFPSYNGSLPIKMRLTGGFGDELPSVTLSDPTMGGFAVSADEYGGILVDLYPATTGRFEITASRLEREEVAAESTRFTVTILPNVEQQPGVPLSIVPNSTIYPDHYAFDAATNTFTIKVCRFVDDGKIRPGSETVIFRAFGAANIDNFEQWTVFFDGQKLIDREQGPTKEVDIPVFISNSAPRAMQLKSTIAEQVFYNGAYTRKGKEFAYDVKVELLDPVADPAHESPTASHKCAGTGGA